MTNIGQLHQKEQYYQILLSAPLTNRMAAHKAGLPVESCCRYKRQLEKEKRLFVAYRGIDPDTRCAANFLTAKEEGGGK